MSSRIIYKIVNFKVQCKIKSPFLFHFLNNKCFNVYKIKEHCNYWVHRDKFVYIIFNNGHINITKIKTFSDLKKALKHLLNVYHLKNKKCLDNDKKTKTCVCYFCLNHIFSNIKIDNLTIYGELFLKTIDLNAVKDLLLRKNTSIFQYKETFYFITNVKYDIQFFPGLFINIQRKRRNRKNISQMKKWGTIILFSNGKFTIVGIKKDKNILKVLTILKSFIQDDV